ncbi:hypothetical protein [Fulvivirga imtechensis]|uniref:hypothetical protein n=1 Tax=Fulvivirga imtechensis TaxID=881893 RepID=UPI00058E4551|nr:hypothetical protein [Fulvivirga imtechensis]
MDSAGIILLNFLLAILSGVISGILAALIIDRIRKKAAFCNVHYNALFKKNLPVTELHFF